MLKTPLYTEFNLYPFMTITSEMLPCRGAKVAAKGRMTPMASIKIGSIVIIEDKEFLLNFRN